MKTDETESIIALQPETDIEQRIVQELFTRLNNVQPDVQPHPTKVGSQRVYYTLDVPEYDLDTDLWEEAECGVNEHGQLDPEPGSRALVVTHSAGAREPTEAEVDEAVDAVKNATGGEDDEESEDDADGESLAFQPGEKTVDWIRDEVRDSDYDTPTLRDLYEAEVNGKARTTALDAFENALDEADESEVAEA